ncbi:diacylglycerol/lipid kinase family protein [Maledivibacter halophilus]|uniref:Lipid kinase, YegS/Rv2252/BmrU family n=1 Tax=Maledivibacter halophilus TaxID=36842 RepID=A0A1T5MM27_9FIRM|nr:diacylglycerol kinase family protein [Maledivibacter halophilus]SKC88919.1 lipid kinase, YegS/Rv2252/BmrU family [Maledivibacter halophilus]
MKKYLFVVNPVAGKGRTVEIIPKIKESFDKDNIQYEVKITSQRGEGEKIVREGIDKGYTHIISVGGDGTAYEVVNGIRREKIVLGILPAGTGNDFARMINMPKDHDEILKVLKMGKTKRVDIGMVNNRYFLNCSSVGIDAEIVKETEAIKQYVSGPLAYLIGVFKTLTKYKNKEVEIFIDNKKIKRNIELVAVSNGKYYGGGMKINPMADFHDGLLDICLVNKINKIKFASLFFTVFKGQHIRFQEVEIFRGKEVKILGDKSLLLNADGDIIGNIPAEINIQKTRIDVIFP